MLEIELFSIPQGKTILVVEDDEGISTLLRETFYEETTHRVLLTDGSLEALRIAKEKLPDLFIVDYWLPYMTGIELYDEFSQIQELEKSPFILISADLPVDEVNRRHIIGIKKPFDLNKLVGIVNKLLNTA